MVRDRVVVKRMDMKNSGRGRRVLWNEERQISVMYM